MIFEKLIEIAKYYDWESIFRGSLKFLSGTGIIYGMGDGTFAPEESITREQAATILYRTAEFLGNKTIANQVPLKCIMMKMIFPIGQYPLFQV